MITIENAKKQYGSLCAVNIPDLTIPNGQILGIIGANGAGKTTFLKAVADLLPVQGDITFHDIFSEKSLHENVVFMTEEFSFFPGMSMKAHADFYADFFDKFDRERYFKLLEFFELPPNRKPRTLSRGQKAKLELAIGFSKGGKYLLLDEPFLGNDIFTRRNFLRLMSESLKNDETIIIATHLIDEIENFIDRAIILSEGSIKYDVMIDDLREQGDNLETLLSKTLEINANKFREMFL
jgi:ABC-2 type transport system ATP-binding protein